MKSTKGLLVAAAAAGIFGAVVAKGLAADATAPAASSADVMCSGINECKGKGACAGADNTCAGKNACKGKGVLKVGTEKECTDKGGKVVKK
ncbi:MAG: hypothetical protein AB1405_11270 [Bdellovibrionota bacterium]